MNTRTKTNPKPDSATETECSGGSGPDCSMTCESKQFCSTAGSAAQKSKLEKTQTMLSVVSTSFGLLGIAGSVIAFGISSFYTGTLEVVPDREIPGLVVKVFTSEGHESVYHTKHISLMPGAYHLEISSPEGKTVHVESKIKFHETSTVPISFPQAMSSSGTQTSDPQAQESARQLSSSPTDLSEMQTSQSGAETPKKRRWWQIWKRSGSESASNESKTAAE